MDMHTDDKMPLRLFASGDVSFWFERHQNKERPWWQ